MSTADPEEIERFSRLSAEWWNPKGPLKPLHDLGPLRIGYIRDLAIRHFGRQEAPQPLAGLTLIDIGCGGGLVCEPMQRLGAQVTGIDASERNIAVAKIHAQGMGLPIDYLCTPAEDLLGTYDIVLALEVIEHVANPEAFVRAALTLARPGGLVVLSTINRTLKAYSLAIIGAEYVLRLLPRGTHTWKKFVRPSELAEWLRRNGGNVLEMQGMALSPLTFKWSLKPDDLSVNYLLAATK